MRRLLCLAILLLVLPAVAQENQEPSAAFAMFPSHPELGEEVSFISTSSDDDGSIVSWTWSINGEIVSEDAAFEWRFDEHGDYAIILTVEDDAGATGEAAAALNFPAPGLLIQTMALFPSWSLWAIPTFIGLALIGTGAVVMIAGTANAYNRIFMLFAFISGAKSLTEAAAIFAEIGSPLQEGFLQANAILAYFLVPTFLWFVVSFPRAILPRTLRGAGGFIILALGIPFLALDLLDILVGQTLINAFNVTSSIIVLLALLLMMRQARYIDCDEQRRRVQLLSYVFMLLVASTVILTALQLAHGAATEAGLTARAARYLALTQLFGLIISPLMELVGLVIMMYAILRFQMMGIEVGLMRLTKGTIFAVVVPSIFIISGNVLEGYVEDTFLGGTQYDFIIAGFIAAISMFPLNVGVNKLVDKMFPLAGTHAEEYSQFRRMEIYEAQLRYALYDGRLLNHELPVLERLAQKIGITPAEQTRIIRRFPGVSPSDLKPAKI